MMDDKFKKLGFKDFISVDYTMTGDEHLAYQAKKRHRGVVGESSDLTNEKAVAVLERIKKVREKKA